MKSSINKLLALAIFLIFTSSLLAQTTLSGGADFVSRYVWRGLDFGNSGSIQPSLSLAAGNFEVGFWGSYPFTNDASGAEEMDLYMSYSISDFSLIVTDYYYPNSAYKYGNYKDDQEGGHIIEAGLSFAGNEKFPISLAAYMNLYNDNDHSVYFEVGYSTEIETVGLDLFVGGTPGGEKLMWYKTDKFNLINVGVKVSKDIKITDDFALPIFTSYVLNPNQEVSYLIFGASLSM
ncbi:MAG: hypothetical protein HYS24_12510 [Ignavibacteriales bacterium]|nr:hypothetical protein [Ignavibacteriales bacterium]MBK7981176.1 hypothetical protein [Ignavibacteriota bacterium]